MPPVAVLGTTGANMYMVNSTGNSTTGPFLAPVPLCSQGGFAPLNPRPIGLEVLNRRPILKDRYNLSLIYDLSPNPRPQLAWRSSIFSEVLNPRPICGLESKTDSKGQDPVV